MPWKERNIMDERVKFIARFLEGGKVTRLAEEFGISRTTAYKIIDRYQDTGLEGLTDRSRRPYRPANQLPWGAPKIMELLARRYPDIHRPAISTVHAVLDRHGLVKQPKERRNKAAGTILSESQGPQ